MRRPALATLALSVLALLFGWETRQALRATPGGQDNAVLAEARQPDVAMLDPQPPPDSAPVVSAIAARPLFRQDRKPFQEGAAAAVGQNYEAQLSRYTLLGVLGFGDAPYGVVVGKGGNKGERWEVKTGDSFQEFTVKEVGIDGLRLTADGQEFLLPLYAGAPTAAGGALRTDTTRHDAKQPIAAPGSPASAKPAASGAPPGPAVTTAPAPAPPRTAPAYNPPFRPPPGRTPRYYPGRR